MQDESRGAIEHQLQAKLTKAGARVRVNRAKGRKRKYTNGMLQKVNILSGIIYAFQTVTWPLKYKFLSLCGIFTLFNHILRFWDFASETKYVTVVFLPRKRYIYDKNCFSRRKIQLTTEKYRNFEVQFSQTQYVAIRMNKTRVHQITLRITKWIFSIQFASSFTETR